jgi:hypothetical protein
VDKFNGKNNFELWKMKIQDFLVQQGLHKALTGKTKRPSSMIDKNREDMDWKALSAI